MERREESGKTKKNIPLLSVSESPEKLAAGGIPIPSKGPQAAFLQIQTLYNHHSGKKRLRVTTIARRYDSACVSP